MRLTPTGDEGRGDPKIGDERRGDPNIGDEGTGDPTKIGGER